jgi:hypothetical protein
MAKKRNNSKKKENKLDAKKEGSPKEVYSFIRKTRVFDERIFEWARICTPYKICAHEEIKYPPTK